MLTLISFATVVNNLVVVTVCMNIAVAFGNSFIIMVVTILTIAMTVVR